MKICCALRCQSVKLKTMLWTNQKHKSVGEPVSNDHSFTHSALIIGLEGGGGGEGWKTSKYPEISQRLLRLSSPLIAEPVTCLINYFITNRQ